MDISNIEKVYSGKAYKCMCGCAGKYSYNEGVAREDWQGAVSTRSIKIIAGKVLKSADAVQEADCTYVIQGNRILVVYFKK
jgi:hypothetical protein